MLGPAHILGRPGGEAKGLGSWAINQLVAFLNLSIVLSAHCTLYKTYPHSALNIELDCIVPAGSSANINCLTPRPHIWSNWSKGSWFYCTSALQVIGHLLLSPPWFYQFSVQTNIQIINFRDWCGCGFITL